MTAAADKVLHGIIMTDMQKNGQILNVFYNLTDSQHLPNEVAGYQEIWALFLVPPLHYWTNTFLGSAFLSCKMDGSIFTFSIHLLLFLASQMKTKLCPDQFSRSCIFNSNGGKNNMYVSKVWLPSNTYNPRCKYLRKVFTWKAIKSGCNNDLMTRKEGLLFSEMIRPSSLVSWTCQWRYPV